jgi:hypothetical protein
LPFSFTIKMFWIVYEVQFESGSRLSKNLDLGNQLIPKTRLTRKPNIVPISWDKIILHVIFICLGAVGIELWSMSDNIYFDNLLITDSLSLADSYAADTFDLKMSKLNVASGGVFRRSALFSSVVWVGVGHVLINYLDTKAKCHLKKLRQVYQS